MILQEKVIRAAIEIQKGSSLKDFLTDEEIHESILMLGDILTCAGYTEPDEDE